MKSVTAKAPATIANLGSAFDCIGLAINGPYDLVSVRRTSGTRVVIEDVKGFDLPLDPEKNTASVAVKALLKIAKIRFGIAIKIKKGIPPGSGLGSSAASAAAAVFAANRLFRLGFSREELIIPAMEGERAVAGTAHADNVAPSLMGNIVLGSASIKKFSIVAPPAGLFCIVVLPVFQLNTKRSRSVLPKVILLKTAANQWSRVALLIDGFHNRDFESISIGIGDEIVEPARKKLIPNFNLIKKTALEYGALGCTISGGGPSMFAFAQGKESARKIARALIKGLKNKKIKYHIYIKSIDKKGARVL